MGLQEGRAEPAAAGAALYYGLEFQTALGVRWAQGTRRYRGGDASLPFVGDSLAEGYEELLDFVLYVRQAQRQGLLQASMARDLERHVMASALPLQRLLLARDNGGVLPADHPALRLRNMASSMAAREAR